MSDLHARDDELLGCAVESARAAGAVLLELFRSDGGMQIEQKGRNDLVSRADREAERAALAVIGGRFPQHAVLAEESGTGGDASSAEVEWIVDPLDGTTNYLHGHPTWCVSVAARRDGEMVVGVVLEPLSDNLFSARRHGGASWNGHPMRVSPAPMEDSLLATGFPFRAHAALDTYLSVFRDVFYACRAIRRCGAAALDLAYTAAGIYSGFFELGLSPWDLAAGALLVREAGGVSTDWNGGDRFLGSGNILAASPTVHGRLLEIVGHCRGVGARA